MGCCLSAEPKTPPPVLSNPSSSKSVTELTQAGLDIQIITCSMQGWRQTMEDVSVVHCALRGSEKVLGVGVFDGHSGPQAAQYASKHIWDNVCASEAWLSPDLEAAFREGFLKTDADMRQEKVCAGTTAVVGLVTETHIYVANCGDSRAVLSRGGVAAPMSYDHKPSRAAEKERVLRCGGQVDESDYRCARVVGPNCNMAIATSRALGDFLFKQNTSRSATEQIVSPEPEVLVLSRVPEDEFLILASDGIWDVMDNQQVCDFISRSARRCVDGSFHSPQPRGSTFFKPFTRLPTTVASCLDACLNKGSMDNMTMVVVDLRPPMLPTERRGSRPNTQTRGSQGSGNFGTPAHNRSPDTPPDSDPDSETPLTTGLGKSSSQPLPEAPDSPLPSPLPLDSMRRDSIVELGVMPPVLSVPVVEMGLEQVTVSIN